MLFLHTHTHCSHYVSQVGGHRVKWKLRGDHIYSESSAYVMKVKVLSEELAYNKSFKQFKMFILERPLDPLYKVDMMCVIVS